MNRAGANDKEAQQRRSYYNGRFSKLGTVCPRNPSQLPEAAQKKIKPLSPCRLKSSQHTHPPDLRSPPPLPSIVPIPPSRRRCRLRSSRLSSPRPAQTQYPTPSLVRPLPPFDSVVSVSRAAPLCMISGARVEEASASTLR